MESDSLYIFPFSAIKFDSKPQYLINIGILIIDTDFFFGWICLVFLSYYFFVFCSTKDFYASCRCQENRHCIILVCALNLQDLQGAYTVPILCIWMNEMNSCCIFKKNDCFNRGWQDFHFCCWNIENMNNESCDNKLIYCNIVHYENEK